MLAKSSVSRPLNVNGRTTFPNGPISLTIVRATASTTDIVRVLPCASKYTRRPSSENKVLCAVPGLSIVAMSAPVFASATAHFGAPSSGAYNVVPSGERAIRSVPRPS